MSEPTLEEKRESILQKCYIGPFTLDQRREFVAKLSPLEVEYYYAVRNVEAIKTTHPIA